jgi:hypothetical protein
MHLKALLIYWWCHILYTLGTMCQSPGRIYSKMCTLKPSLQSLPLRNTRFCGLPCAATTVHSAINKLCVVVDGTYKAARNAEWGHADKVRDARVGSLRCCRCEFLHITLVVLIFVGHTIVWFVTKGGVLIACRWKNFANTFVGVYPFVTTCSPDHVI